MKNTWFLLLAKALFMFDQLLKTLIVVFLIVIYRDPLRDQEKNLKKKINVKFNTFIKSLKPLLAKNLSAVQETWVRFLSQRDLLEKEMATHSSILAWKIQWTEKPGGLQSMGSQRVGHDWVTSLQFIVIITDIMIIKYIDWQSIPCTGTSSIRSNLCIKDS